MTLSNKQRVIRCQQAITAYSDDEAFPNFIDFLADALLWCRLNGHSFHNALETALTHFNAELIANDLYRKPSQKRNKP